MFTNAGVIEWHDRDVVVELLGEIGK
jgi:hypothetical protein